MKIRFVIPCLLGLESIIANEMKTLGAEDVVSENGRVLFSGDEAMLARANICSRFPREFRYSSVNSMPEALRSFFRVQRLSRGRNGSAHMMHFRSRVIRLTQRFSASATVSQ